MDKERVETTGSACKFCRSGVIVRSVKRVPEPELKLTGGTMGHYEVRELYCEQCGLKYHHLPPNGRFRPIGRN